jgi:hypothetical protein
MRINELEQPPPTWSALMEALRLYRALLKVARRYEVPHIRKRMTYNIRDMFEVFGDEKDSGRVQNLISRGWKVHGVLEKLSTIDELNAIMKTRDARPELDQR